jgi:hypothetical protein
MGIRTVVLLLVGAGLLSCAGGGPRARGGSGNIITAEQMSLYPNASAWEVVQRFRPRFLQPRGQSSIANPDASYPVVYVDGMRRGGIAELRQIPVVNLETIEYIASADATTRWGTGHAAGVILVTSRR